MIRRHPFQASDLLWIDIQPAQKRDWLKDRDALLEHGKLLEQHEHSYSFRDAEGTLVACIGLIKTHDELGTIWSILSEAAGPHLLHLTRWGRAYLADMNLRRFDLGVRASHLEGHRWAEMLGFSHEAAHPAWYPDGEAQHIYSRLRGPRHG